jgi:hypothetical protein
MPACDLTRAVGILREEYDGWERKSMMGGKERS